MSSNFDSRTYLDPDPAHSLIDDSSEQQAMLQVPMDSIVSVPEKAVTAAESSHRWSTELKESPRLIPSLPLPLPSPPPQTPQSNSLDSASGSSTESSSGDAHIPPSPSPPLSRNKSSEALTHTRKPSVLSSRSTTFVSSPLNPSTTPPPTLFGPKRSPSMRPNFPRVPSEDARALSQPSTISARGSMILYRFNADDFDGLSPPPTIRDHPNRSSVASSADSLISLSSDSKYPSNFHNATERGVVAYAYDPDSDELEEDDDEFHNPKLDKAPNGISGRGIINFSMLIVLVLALLALFVVYPALTLSRLDGHEKEEAIRNCMNSTGQVVETLPNCAPFRVQRPPQARNQILL